MRKLSSMMKGLVATLLLCCFSMYAQAQTVTGTVTDADKKTPLAGVTVKVIGSTSVAQTNEKGAFTIKASAGQTLSFTFVGFETQKATVSGGSISISLKGQTTDLDEVVVAMDIKRKPRELGYSVQQVSGKEIQQTQRENFLNSLQGRVAGLTITPTNGAAGASSQIVLRGFNSLSLSNQPIFVVDGIIIDNSTQDETSNGGTQLGLGSDRPNRTNDYTNRIADINPNDIESVTILKGPEATALYGSQASSGAIVISTKKAKLSVTGKSTLSVTYDNSFRIQKVTKFPAMNNDYASGANGVASNSFSFFGPAYPSDTKKYDNINSFFRTGVSQTHNLGVEFGGKTSSYRLSASYFGQDGVIPRNSYIKTTIRLSNFTKVGKYIDFSPSITYSNAINDRPLRGAGGYYLNLLNWPLDNDITTYLDANGHRKQAFSLNSTGETIDNPLYNAIVNHSQDVTGNWIMNLGVNIRPTSWLTLSGRFGYNTYKTSGYIFQSPESATAYTTGGAQDNWWTSYYGYNHTITATATKKVGKFSLRVMVGTMWQDYKKEMFAISGTKLIDSSGRRTDSGNITSGITRLLLNNAGLPNLEIKRQMAYFGEVSIGFKNVAFLSFTQRYEAASIFPKDYRNYNYPAGSLSVILTDIFPGLKNGGVLSYAKLRASLASTARISDPYMNQSVFVQNFASSIVAPYSYGFFNNNPFLRPERQKTYEVGGEIKLFNNRINIDAAYYNTLAVDQISQGYRASYATGFVLNTQNAASTRNQGVELSIDVTPIRKKNFEWTTRFNFNHMWSEVLALPDAIAYEYYIADTWLYGNARGGLIRGASTGTITAYGYQRNNNGAILISPTTGLPLVDANFLVRADRTPAFTLGINNILRYKNWNLSFLWDLKMGGAIFDGTEEYLTINGKSARTADRKTPRVVKGVLSDGLQNTATPTANTIAITPYYLQSYYTSMPEEEFIQKDVNWLRLRDVTLSYTLSEKYIRRVKGLKSLSIFATGNDLFLITNYKGADPATNGNTALSKGIGGSGFDYGNLPTPLGLNFGLRANF